MKCLAGPQTICDFHTCHSSPSMPCSGSRIVPIVHVDGTFKDEEVQMGIAMGPPSVGNVERASAAVTFGEFR